MKYATIQLHAGEFEVRMMCRVLEVSASGYYRWCAGKSSSREQARRGLDERVRRAFEAQKCRAGAPRLTRALKSIGCTAGRNQVARSLREQGLRAKGARKYKATTNAKHNLPVAPNLLKQDFTAAGVDQKWVSDLTYIHTEEGWLYLAVILDLYSRRVVGWSMSSRMTAELTCAALRMALRQRGYPCGVILHSDRGSQYCAGEYQKIIRACGLICSMSAKGNCYDNAAMESWNHSLKVEAVHGERFITRHEAKTVVFDYIEVYYNRQRLHSTLGYLSPVDFEAANLS